MPVGKYASSYTKYPDSSSLYIDKESYTEIQASKVDYFIQLSLDDKILNIFKAKDILARYTLKTAYKNGSVLLAPRGITFSKAYPQAWHTDSDSDWDGYEYEDPRY
jgi:hypothetical protein